MDGEWVARIASLDQQYEEMMHNLRCQLQAAPLPEVVSAGNELEAMVTDGKDRVDDLSVQESCALFGAVMMLRLFVEEMAERVT